MVYMGERVPGHHRTPLHVYPGISHCMAITRAYLTAWLLPGHYGNLNGDTRALTVESMLLPGHYGH